MGGAWGGVGWGGGMCGAWSGMDWLAVLAVCAAWSGVVWGWTGVECTAARVCRMRNLLGAVRWGRAVRVRGRFATCVSTLVHCELLHSAAHPPAQCHAGHQPPDAGRVRARSTTCVLTR